MATTETDIQPPVNRQGLDIRPTPREEMNLYPLDTFPYEYAGREIRINFELPEFTCVCPFSDFPDFAPFRVEYLPADLVGACDPLEVNIEGDFNVRGNVKTVVRASYKKERSALSNQRSA